MGRNGAVLQPQARLTNYAHAPRLQRFSHRRGSMSLLLERASEHPTAGLEAECEACMLPPIAASNRIKATHASSIFTAKQRVTMTMLKPLLYNANARVIIRRGIAFSEVFAIFGKQAVGMMCSLHACVARRGRSAIKPADLRNADQQSQSPSQPTSQANSTHAYVVVTILNNIQPNA
eukprot:scaffold9073_cov33-Prasinocladus_malaysianus.AAC.2